MANTSNNKKLITKDWQSAFPQLTYFSPGKFYKVLGPLITGIELIKLPRLEAYRPHFVIYSLWGNRNGNDLKACLSWPNILQQYYTKRGGQFDILYEKHSLYFDEALDCIKAQTPFSFDKDVPLSELFNFIAKYSKIPPLGAAPNSFLQAKLFEFKLYTTLYTNSGSQIQNVLSEIQKKNWDIDHFALWNTNIEHWMESMRLTVMNSDTFTRTIISNLESEKLIPVKRNEIIV